MRRLLQAWFVLVLAVMLGLTLWASRHEHVLAALARFAHDPWALATLADAYFAFLACWLWIAWRERSWTARLLWLLGILALGNLALATYGLLQLSRLRAGEGAEALLRRRD